MTSPDGPTEETTGSPAPGGPDFFGETEFLAVGKLRRPHGVAGEMVMDVLTDFPERLKPGMRLYRGQSRQVLHVKRCREYANGLLITFVDVQDKESAGLLRNEILYVRADEIPDLPEGEYYHHQLLGLRVIGDGKRLLGTVVDILETGANDVAVVRPASGRDILIPLADVFIQKIDLQAGEIHVRLMEGLVSGEENGEKGS